MSKSYIRAQTPTTPPPLTKNPGSSKDGYDLSSKSYRAYSKYDTVNSDTYDRSKYDKVLKNDRFDKFEKTNYKSVKSVDYDCYSTKGSLSKNHMKDSKYRPSEKSDSSYRDRELTVSYKSKGSVYRSDSYSDREQYLAKYAHDGFSKPYSARKDSPELKHSTRPSDSKRYSPYRSVPNTKSSSVAYSSKYGSSSQYYNSPYEEPPYSSSRKSKPTRERSKDYSSSRHVEVSTESYNNYQRFVIGDSVVYGSPGHYPKDLPLPPSPKAKRRRSSFSPPSSHSRFTPPRFHETSKTSRRSPYRTPPRRPPSPPPIPNYRSSSPQRYFRRDFSPSPDKRHNGNKGRNGRDVESNKYGASRSYGDDRRAIPRPVGSPKPLLSIPLSLNNVPKESRANLMETLNINSPPKRRRRLEGRIGRGSSKKRLSSPKEKKRRRPDDLRLWIESRKVDGGKRAASPRVKRDRAPAVQKRSRLQESRKRILNKGKRKTNLPIKRIAKGRRSLAQRKTEGGRRSPREKRRVEGGTRAGRVVKRPRVVSTANSLPVARRRSPKPPRKVRSRSRSRQRTKHSSDRSHHQRSKSRERSTKREKSREDQNSSK